MEIATKTKTKIQEF